MFHAVADVTVFLLVQTMFFQHVDLKLNKSKTSQLFLYLYHDSLDEYQNSGLHPLMDSFQAKNK